MLGFRLCSQTDSWQYFVSTSEPELWEGHTECHSHEGGLVDEYVVSRKLLGEIGARRTWPCVDGHTNPFHASLLVS